ncbi:MAG: DUF2892 domain-containing protein [Solirubrobacterales bacterium]|nr:DUF2892 domain-containing protein [Solirubrobacterales bacterium]
MSVIQYADSTCKEQAGQTWGGAWPLERLLFLLAGIVLLVATALAALVSPWFLLLTGFVGVNQLLYASVGFCGASLILRQFTSAEPACAKGSSQ